MTSDSMDPERATSFGAVAETYDRLRPSYPHEMFDDLVVAAGLEHGSPVFELGCGTGLATTQLVRRGFAVTALDPDARMLGVARNRLHGADVTFVTGRFEDFAGPAARFRLVLAAASWHWVDPDAALPLAARLLEPAGSLAVCWNMPRPEDLPRPDGLDAAYRRFAPELAEMATQVRNRGQEHRRAGIADSHWFEEPMSFSYRWRVRLSTAEYCGLLSTHSDHRLLGPDRSARLLAAVAEVVDDWGGRIDLAYETVMYVAPRSARDWNT